MSQSNTNENKMGVLPIPKLLLQMSLPMMLSMLVQALYNVVDSIFVARINENALTAVSLVFPVQNLMIAIAVGTGVGVNAVLSRSLGEKDFHTAYECQKWNLSGTHKQYYLCNSRKSCRNLFLSHPNR